MATKVDGIKFCVVQFAKTPILGNVKTRMEPFLSKQKALALHKDMLMYTLENISNNEIPIYLYSTNGGEFIENACQQFNVRHELQQGSDLGQRLINALDKQSKSFDLVCFVGSDCPFITSELIDQVHMQLRPPEVDVTIIPASDGGYVLIAIKGCHKNLFEDIDWGTSRVFEQTLAKAKHRNLNISIFPELNDIDRPEDLSLHPITEKYLTNS